MIVGLGVDAVEIDRIRQALERHASFARRVYTAREREAAARRGVGEVAYLARRWAAKEAASKALGVGFSGFAYTDLEIVNLPSGAPTIRIAGELEEWARSLGVVHWHLSLSDTRELAFATAIAEGPDDYRRRPPGPPPWVRRRRTAGAAPIAPGREPQSPDQGPAGL